MVVALFRGGLRSLLGLVLGSVLLAWGASPAACDPPRLRIEPAGEVDLGSLGPRENRLQRYYFRNLSTTPIALRVFDLSPGVTVAGLALERPIPAGSSQALDLSVDPSGWSGFQVRNVRLGTDDPGQGNYYLPIRMLVRADLAVDGERRDWGDVAVPGSPEQSFLFKRESGAPVVLRVLSNLPPYLELRREDGAGSARLVFTLRSGRVPPGVRLGFEQVQVETNDPLEPHFDLYLAWKVHHPVEAAPSRVVFRKPEQRRPLTLNAEDHKPFQLLAAQVDGAGFRVEGPVQFGREGMELTVTRTAEGPARAMLVLTFLGDPDPLWVPLAYLP